MYTKENNKTNPNLILQDNLFCRYCKRQCKNLNSLKQHEIRCKNNPDRVKIHFNHNGNLGHNKGSAAWNAGLSKETDERLDKLSQKLKGKALNPYGGTAATPEKELERKCKISATMRANGNAGGLREGAGRGHKGSYKGYYCDSTYELAFIIYNLDHNIPFERCPKTIYYTYTNNGKTYKYYPDFLLQDGSLIEIKGYQSDLVALKVAAVKDRPIKVLYENDLQYAFNYVFEAYKVKKLEELYDK